MAKVGPKGSGRARHKRVRQGAAHDRGRAARGPGAPPVASVGAESALAATRRTAMGMAPAHAGSAWSGAAATGGAPGPLAPLNADVPTALLILAGAEHVVLRDALQAWGDAQDHAANRMWRRPGGLTRLAGI